MGAYICGAAPAAGDGWRGGGVWRVDGVVVPAGQLKNSVEWSIGIARDSENT